MVVYPAYIDASLTVAGGRKICKRKGALQGQIGVKSTSSQVLVMSTFALLVLSMRESNSDGDCGLLQYGPEASG